MPNADLLAGLGLFVRRGFLDAELCRAVRREMASAARTPALLRPHGEPGAIVAETTRRTGIADVSAATAAGIEDRLLAIKPALEAYFRVDLAGCQPPQFYIYEAGDFFAPHRDSDVDPQAPSHIQARQVSLSILLNDALGGPDDPPYQGGALVFYGTRADRAGATFGIPLEGEIGMLVAFRSDWTHEVRPVTSGRRYSIVTWFS
jgi:predicted 2-oxoglutarate/Fe(II)-dependent dioxygenase YbiX